MSVGLLAFIALFILSVSLLAISEVVRVYRAMKDRSPDTFSKPPTQP